MATLPSNRTKLQSAVSDQSQSLTPASGKANREALIEVYDTIDLLNQKVDTLVPVGAVTPAPPAFISRQAIINGNFDVWQRGTSSALAGYLADRWAVFMDGAGGAKTVSRQSFAAGQTDVPNNPKYFWRNQVTTAPNGQTYNALVQRIEWVQLFAGMKATVSFWAKADASRSITAKFIQRFGSGGSADVITSSQSFTLTTVWTKYTATFDVPSISGKIIGTNDNLTLNIDLPQNSLHTIDIAQVQLCAGDTALPFQPRSFADELALCQRYFEKSFLLADAPGVAIGYIGYRSTLVTMSGRVYSNPAVYKVRKRISPTVTLYADGNTAVGNLAFYDSAGVVTYSAPTIGPLRDVGFTVDLASTTFVLAQGHWTADAEI